MKKVVFLVLSVLCGLSSLSAKSFNIDEKKTESVSGIKKIVFEVSHPKCAMCINTANYSYDFYGGDENDKMSLSLTGDLKTNKKDAVPSLLVSRQKDTMIIRLFKEESLFFALTQSGSVQLEVGLPQFFDGNIDIIASSGKTTAEKINVSSISIDSSSGGIYAKNVTADRISLESSSGHIEASELVSSGRIDVQASSGDLYLDTIESNNLEVEASSGRIEIGEIDIKNEVCIDSSSGRILASKINCAKSEIKASSGKISIDQLTALSTDIVASSGDITLKELNGGVTDIKSSSGEIDVNISALSGDTNIVCSSGGVEILMPEDASFDLELKASSGDIRSNFAILSEIDNDKNKIKGTVNNGGYLVYVKATSGDITLNKK